MRRQFPSLAVPDTNSPCTDADNTHEIYTVWNKLVILDMARSTCDYPVTDDADKNERGGKFNRELYSGLGTIPFLLHL